MHDIQMLSTAIGKSRDDSCLLMHLILRNIASQNTAIRKDVFFVPMLVYIIHALLFPAIAPGLDSREHRAEWERCFSDTFIKPVLMVCCKKLLRVYNTPLELGC